jgi:putative transposase
VHPPRIPGFPYVGLQRYFLTICTDHRRPVFVCAPVVLPVLAQFRRSTARFGFAVLAYCFMPDHVHFLYEAMREDADLLSCISDAKQRSGYAFRRSNGNRLWQVGFYDHVLRDDDRVPVVIRYIVENPVRAGLATRLGDYEFCGSDRYSMEEIAACNEVWSPRPGVQ